MIGIGVLLGDESGSILMSLTKPLKYLSNPAIVEARSLLEVVLLMYRSWAYKLFFEADSSQVVAATTTHHVDYGIISPLVCDIKFLLSSMSWNIRQVKRGANKVAHILATEAIKLPIELLDIDAFAFCIHSLVIA